MVLLLGQKIETLAIRGYSNKSTYPVRATDCRFARAS
jgi:hypothetical protein